MAEEWFAIMPPIEMQRGLVGIYRSKHARQSLAGIKAPLRAAEVGTKSCRHDYRARVDSVLAAVCVSLRPSSGGVREVRADTNFAPGACSLRNEAP